MKKLILAVLLLAFSWAVTDSYAATGGNGAGGGHPGAEPPTECSYPFLPSFVYVQPGGRHSADATYLADRDGCSIKLLPGVVGSTVGKRKHS